jgi:acetyl-CoA acetyltransferase
MMNRLRGAAAIAGFGDAYADEDHPKTPLQLAAEATANALADAGLVKDDLDGLLTGREPSGDPRPAYNTVIAAYMRLTPTYSTQANIHAAGLNAMLKHAALAVVTGQATHVLCVCGDSLTQMDAGAFIAALDADPQFEVPYGPSMPSLYAQSASRYMHEYGITEDHLARVVVAAQDWAVHHPHATKAKFGPITKETVFNSRMIASPFRIWHCAMWGPPGTGAAFIVTTSERAEALTQQPIYLLGFGECSTHEYMSDRMSLRSSRLDLGVLPNLTTTGTKVAAQRAFELAELGPWDMDLVMTSGNFAHMPLMLLEDLGFCGKGEAGAFVDEGHIDADGGDIHFNTNGGWLSFGQPGISCVTDLMVEAVRQMRGQALGRQVERVEHAVVQSVGGPFAGNSVTVLGKER